MFLNNLFTHPLELVVAATLFTWLMAVLGSAMVFFFHSVKTRTLDFMLGFAAGVMITASVLSLLSPAIRMSGGNWVPAVVGFLLGGAFLRLIDLIIPHLHQGSKISESEGIKTHWKKRTLIILAETMHNIPEGLALGFGIVAFGMPSASSAGAIALALGIGIQNFPEGVVSSVPLRRDGLSTAKSFFWGQFSGMVEPIAGVLGALIVLSARSLLPYAMAFAAGAMIYVVYEEVLPESQKGKYYHLSTIGVMLGFAVMMILDATFA
jgi:ZIP family zinc transporter